MTTLHSRRSIVGFFILLMLVGCSNNPPLDPTTALSSSPTSALLSSYDVQHYRLAIEVFPDQERIEGEVTVRAIASSALDTVELDLDPRYSIESATVNGERVDATLTNGKLYLNGVSINAGSEFQATVTYSGKPYVAENPPWDGGFVWTTTEDGQPWIATAVQGRGCDLYWPCKDQLNDKPDEGVDLLITVPEGLTAAMNGTLVDTQTIDGKSTFHWRTRHPISTYHLAINIGPYETYELSHQSIIDGAPEVPLVYYHVTRDQEKIEGLIRDDFTQQIRFMESLVGPYPWGDEKIGIVEIPYLGMEHQTMNGYGNGYKDSPAGFDWLILHEFIHEWFGNLLTQQGDRDFFLHEGITSYLEHLYYRQTVGDAAYWAEMWRRYNQIQNCKPVLPSEAVSMDYFDSNDVYFKGNWTLMSLRWLMGEAPFWRTIRRVAYGTEDPWRLNYPIAPRSRSVEDFIQIASEEHGSDLNWFFDVYLRGTELPLLEIERDDDRLKLSWANYPDFPMPVPVSIITQDESTTITIVPNGEWVEIGDVDRVQIDQRNHVFRDFGFRDWCEQDTGN